MSTQPTHKPTSKRTRNVSDKMDACMDACGTKTSPTVEHTSGTIFSSGTKVTTTINTPPSVPEIIGDKYNTHSTARKYKKTARTHAPNIHNF